MLIDINIKQLTDIKLISRYKVSGNSIFIGELYQRYAYFVFCVCMKYFRDDERSKDAAMNIFEKLLIDLRKHEIDNFKPWLHTVTKNYCIEQLRNSKNYVRYDDEVKNNDISFVENYDVFHLNTEEDKENKLKLLESAINELDEEQKECIILFFMKDKCYAQISEITGYSMSNIKSYIQNGKRNLKIYMQKQYGKQI